VAAAARVVWARHPSVLAASIGHLSPLILGRIDRIFRSRALQAEGHAKVSAPWQDRTGAARNGIRGTSHVDASRAELALSHAVDYGVWLELANHGRFAASIPQMQITVRDVMHDLRGLL
jgi:hypothetical protein